MDIISIKQLAIESSIGVKAWEKQVKQVLSLDIDYATDATTIAINDDLNDAVDYAAMAEKTTEFVQQQHWQLLETLAERLSQYLIKEFTLTWLKLTISKPSPIENTKAVIMCVERSA